jgi:hypothetical protein
LIWFKAVGIEDGNYETVTIEEEGPLPKLGVLLAAPELGMLTPTIRRQSYEDGLIRPSSAPLGPDRLRFSDLTG